jgi:hypothetical protein
LTLTSARDLRHRPPKKVVHSILLDDALMPQEAGVYFEL